MKIVIFGLGHVGSAYLSYLKDKNDVFVVDPEFNKDYYPLDTELALICVNTPLNEETGHLDTSIVEQCIESILSQSKDIDIVIKSTVSIGFTNNMINKYQYNRIFISPEFLREKCALEDIKNPSRIVVGTTDRTLEGINKYLSLFDSKNILIVGTKEAEAIKLFSNTYLAMRLSFFNELDTLADKLGFDSSDVIRGMGYDSRIGDTYNVPSNGWGGSCLPKDSQELANVAKENGLEFFDSINQENVKRKAYKNK